MDALSGSGVPVVAGRGALGGWSLLEEYQTRLNGLSPEEVQSLFVSTPPAMMRDLGLQRAADSAWIKLRAALPAGVRHHAEFVRQRVLIDSRGWRSAGDSAASLPALLDAVWRERRVRFEYESVLHETSERTVEPLGLVARGSVWYLIAIRDAEVRTYRVSRIRNPEILEAAAKRPADFELAGYWERSAAEFREKLPQYRSTFLEEPSVLRWARYRGWRLEEETPEGDRVRIRIRFDAEEEALQFALSFGGGVEVVEPVPLRAKVRDAAREIMRLYPEQE
jgi:predicted DNA-binding transcriptional regulator YafY